jgi:hypothetical protein
VYPPIAALPKALAEFDSPPLLAYGVARRSPTAGRPTPAFSIRGSSDFGDNTDQYLVPGCFKYKQEKDSISSSDEGPFKPCINRRRASVTRRLRFFLSDDFQKFIIMGLIRHRLSYE